MVTLSQARERIWKSILDHGGPFKVSALTVAGGDEPAVSVSMLYKFKASKDGTGARSRLGRESVTALAQVLSDVDAETWLAAMGVGEDATSGVEVAS